MIEKAQIKGLEKLVNSNVIKDIYPVIDEIEIHYSDKPFEYLEDTLHLNIYLNNPEANKNNLWDKFNFDETSIPDESD
jgi:hypothetical protein